MGNSKFTDYRKSSGGAILFQVLLGLGLMVIMSPIIFNQIKKYNEEIQREEVISSMEKLQKAVSSFVVFEKDTGNIPSGLTCWKDTSGCPTSAEVGGASRPVQTKKMKSFLSDYLGNGSGSIEDENGFGQEYSFATYKNGDEIEAVVIASCKTQKCIDDLTLNGIGQFLFDKGAVIASDGVLLSDLSMSNNLKGIVDAMITSSGSGALVMFVSDAFFSSDFLHIAEMPGETSKAILFNTMIVDLDMNRHNINNVANLYGTTLNIVSSSNVGVVSLSDIVFKSNVDVNNFVEYKNTAGISGVSTLPFGAKKESSGGEIYLNNFDVENTSSTASFDKINIDVGDLTTSEIEADNYVVLGNTTVNDWSNMSIYQMTANTMNSVGNVPDEFSTITLNDVGTAKDSFVYVGSYNASENRYLPDSLMILNLSGISEVKDICYMSGPSKVCLSTEVKNLVTALKNALSCYLKYRGTTIEGGGSYTCL